MYKSVQKHVVSEKTPLGTEEYRGTLVNYKKNKLNINQRYSRRRNSGQRHRKYFQEKYRRKFLKRMSTKVQEAYGMQRKQDQKWNSTCHTYNNQNTNHTEQRLGIQAAREKVQVRHNGRLIRITPGDYSDHQTVWTEVRHTLKDHGWTYQL